MKCAFTAQESPQVLLDREQCLTELDQWLFTTVGRGCIVLIHGETGIGKTALVREFTRRQSGRRVLWGACDDLFTPRALAPLHDMARHAKGTLLETLNSGANRDIVFHAVLDDLERSTPAIVVFEDMHWADEATLDLLKFLGRRIHRTRAMLVVTYRDDEVSSRHPLRFVTGDLPREHVRRLTLAPLSEQAVAKLARQSGQPAADLAKLAGGLGSVAGGKARSNLHALTDGNPLLVMEILGACSADVPVSTRDAVLARAGRLSPAARDIAEIVSVFPGGTDIRPLAAESDESIIDSCRSIGVTRNKDGLLAFRHEVVRRAFESSLSRTRRHTLHTRMLEILMTDANVTAARLAYHADGCGNADAVLRYACVAAAEAASAGAHREAARHYQTALRHAGELDTDSRAILQEKLAYECYLIGDATRAAQLFTQVLETGRGVGNRQRAGTALRWLSTLAWDRGRRDDAIRHKKEADELLASGQMESTEACGADATGVAGAEESLLLASAEGFPHSVARAYVNATSAAFFNRQYGEARRYQQEGLEYCSRQELAAWRLNLLACGARLKLDRGDWIGCCEDVDAVLRGSCATVTTRICALVVLARVRLRRGDPDPESLLREARGLAASLQESDSLGSLAVARAEAAWLADDRASAIRTVLPVYDPSRQKSDSRIHGELAVWLFRLGALADEATYFEEPYALEIAGKWQAAAEAWRELGCPYEHATVLALYGGEAEKREALAHFEALGASPAARAIRRQFRAAGVRKVPRGARSTTRSNQFGLTRREAEVLSLLSNGMRNSAIASVLFVSRKTVDHHVSSILGKLGVPSRGAAVVAARAAAVVNGH